MITFTIENNEIVSKIVGENTINDLGALIFHIMSGNAANDIVDIISKTYPEKTNDVKKYVMAEVMAQQIIKKMTTPPKEIVPALDPIMILNKGTIG